MSTGITERWNLYSICTISSAWSTSQSWQNAESLSTKTQLEGEHKLPYILLFFMVKWNRDTKGCFIDILTFSIFYMRCRLRRQSCGQTYSSCTVAVGPDSNLQLEHVLFTPNFTAKFCHLTAKGRLKKKVIVARNLPFPSSLKPWYTAICVLKWILWHKLHALFARCIY